MKRLLTAFSVLAIINLLGILGAAGWLIGTQRINKERLDAVREILHEPIPAESAKGDADAEGQPLVETENGIPVDDPADPLPANPPLPAEQLVSLQREFDQAAEFRAQRFERENTVLTQTSTLVLRQLDRERKEFEDERDRFERRQSGIAAMRGNEQFQAALSVLISVKPADAQAMLQEIIDGRAGALSVEDPADMTGMDRAVAYLDELDERIRGKVMAEFVKESPTVAADLLERLRTYGLMAEATGPQTP
ncbi:hypothetical protein JYT82_00225 [bacterium AH-315-K20]|nr:hypothetical protein [bacterium AH-315-K20]